MSDIFRDNPGFDEWLTTGFQAELTDYPTIDLMKENFDWLDIIFLLLGIVMAFRLASANGRS